MFRLWKPARCMYQRGHSVHLVLQPNMPVGGFSHPANLRQKILSIFCVLKQSVQIHSIYRTLVPTQSVFQICSSAWSCMGLAMVNFVAFHINSVPPANAALAT